MAEPSSVAQQLRRVHAAVAPVVPILAAVAAFLGGASLLLSGAMPNIASRVLVLRDWLPLSVIEASHFIASLAGMLLLFLAQGLRRRLDAAFLGTLALLGAGAVMALARGFDFEEAAGLVAAGLLLVPFRAQFYRRASLLGEPFSVAWLVATVLVVGASVGLGFFNFRHVEYRSDLFWRFAFEQDAPRFLRATAGVLCAALAVGAGLLLRPARGQTVKPTEEELGLARPLVHAADTARAHLALVRDKALLFNAEKTAFLMYGVEGRAWVVMGDPVGPEKEATELAWRFRELVDQHHGWPCFLEVSPQTLSRYVDLGLSLFKVGEEAIVSLKEFSLEGSHRSKLRQNLRNGEKEGLTFEVLPASEVRPLVSELEAISNEWLDGKGRREHAFSLGYFDRDYVADTPVALARREGRIVAFANLWAPACKSELSIDLMRYGAAAPRMVMDYLFIQLMLWGKAQGYERFSLGGAPFSGLEERALAPSWHKLGAFLFRHGEHFYNFQGVRQFKEKFKPQWMPRYLAAPRGLALPRVLAAIAALGSRAPPRTVGTAPVVPLSPDASEPEAETPVRNVGT